MPTNPELIYIDLDDPTPRWYYAGAVLMAFFVVAMLFAPLGLSLYPSTRPVTADQVSTKQSQVESGICRPTVDFPSFAQPAASVAMPSWMRLCDWFSEPQFRPTSVPEPAP